MGETGSSVSLGTSGVVFANSKEFVVDEKNRLHSFCNANGQYHVMGERTPHNDSNAKSTFTGMTMTTKKKDMTRAILEGVGFSLRDVFEIMKDMGIKISEITINGGGARNQFWCQTIADILNVNVKKVNSDDGPAYGAAILAAVGHGLFDSVDEACNAFIETDKNTRDFSHEMNCQLCQLFTIISQNSLNIYQHMSIYIVGR